MRSWRKPRRLEWAASVFVTLTFTLILWAYSSNESPWPEFFNTLQRRRLETRLPTNPIPVWVVFTRAKENPLKSKLRSLLASLLSHTRSPVTLHLVTDASSRDSAHDVVTEFQNFSHFSVVYYDIHVLTNPIQEIINAMRAHFSSTPGAYYSSNLFFLSAGLYRVAPSNQTRVIMLDVDTVVRADIAELFDEFNRFGPDAVVGAAPELTPVYHHILYTYRSRNKDTKLGTALSQGGFPGVNSGVLLLNLAGMKLSPIYQRMLVKSSIAHQAKKYFFKGHLGDQDFYTLLGLSDVTRPLLHLLDCGWNRQLCDWWRHHGYSTTFDMFSACPSLTKIYHGNCNSRIPDND